MEKPKKEIDAVRLVRRIRDAHFEKLKDVSRAERIAFFNSKVGQQRPDSDRARRAVV
jgi:hypothetical protein